MNFNVQKLITFARKAFRIYQDVSAESQKSRSTSSSQQKSSAQQIPADRRAQTSHANSGYPGDYRGAVDLTYLPENDGEPDPGEIVWAWVPYEEDYSQGKDRPVLIIGKHGNYYLALMLTSKDHNNSQHRDSRYLDIGSGNWDKSGRESEIKLDRVLQIDEGSVRREGAVLPRSIYNRVKQAFEENHRA